MAKPMPADPFTPFLVLVEPMVAAAKDGQALYAEHARLTEQNAALQAEQASIKAETARLESDQAATRKAWAQETEDHAAVMVEQAAALTRVERAVGGYLAQAERARRELHQVRRAEQPSGPVTVPETEGVRP